MLIDCESSVIALNEAGFWEEVSTLIENAIKERLFALDDNDTDSFKKEIAKKQLLNSFMAEVQEVCNAAVKLQYED